MVTVLLGVLLSSGAQAPSNVYLGCPAYGYYGGCFCAPCSYPVVVAGPSAAEKAIKDLRKRLKSLEEKFAQTEPQVKLTREALFELAGKVDKIDDTIKTKEGQFLQLLKELGGRIDGVEDTIKTKEPLVKAKLDELGERLKGLEDSTKPALQKLGARVRKVETTLKDQEEAKKKAVIDDLANRLKKIEESQKPAPLSPPPPQAGGLTSSLDRFIDRLKKVDVEMRDDSKVQAINERLGRVESTLGAEQQKMQSALDALRSISENLDKGFLGVNSRLRELEQTAPKSAPAVKETELEQKKTEESKDEDGFGWAAPTTTALLTVNLPADARIFLDGKATAASGGVRAFVTPTLEKGKQYSYLVRAEVSRNGATVTEMRTVTFQAGSRVRVSFDDLGTDAMNRIRTVRAN